MKQFVLGPGMGPNYDWSMDNMTVKTSRDWADGRVTIVEDRLKAGFHLARHCHRIMTEIFYILEGDVDFQFDDEAVHATPGMTINIPPRVWHEVRCVSGGKLLTIFTPAGFDGYLEELSRMIEADFADGAKMTALSEKYDTWTQQG